MHFFWGGAIILLDSIATYFKWGTISSDHFVANVERFRGHGVKIEVTTSLQCQVSRWIICVGEVGRGRYSCQHIYFKLLSHVVVAFAILWQARYALVMLCLTAV